MLLAQQTETHNLFPSPVLASRVSSSRHAGVVGSAGFLRPASDEEAQGRTGWMRDVPLPTLSAVDHREATDEDERPAYSSRTAPVSVLAPGTDQGRSSEEQRQCEEGEWYGEREQSGHGRSRREETHRGVRQ
jgi:hypothetical protein